MSTSSVSKVTHRGTRCLTPKHGFKTYPEVVTFRHKFEVDVVQIVRGTEMEKEHDITAIEAGAALRTDPWIGHLEGEWWTSRHLTYTALTVDRDLLLAALETMPHAERIELLQKSLAAKMGGAS
jgi:hypothetical protein